MARKDDLLKQAEKLGLTIPAKATVKAIEQAIAQALAQLAAPVKVSRPASRRGRKSHVKPGMIRLVQSWAEMFQPGETIVLPDVPEDITSLDGAELHSALTLLRHHFRKYAKGAGLNAGTDYTIEFSPEYGAVITRLK